MGVLRLGVVITGSIRVVNSRWFRLRSLVRTRVHTLPHSLSLSLSLSLPPPLPLSLPPPSPLLPLPEYTIFSPPLPSHNPTTSDLSHLNPSHGLPILHASHMRICVVLLHCMMAQLFTQRYMICGMCLIGEVHLIMHAHGMWTRHLLTHLCPCRGQRK